MQFEFDDGQRDLHERFARMGVAVAEAASAHDERRSFDHENWQRISDAGIWRLPVPREMGGLGGTWSDCVAAVEGLATTAEDLGFMITMLGHVGSLRVILEEGTPEQRARWLEPLMAGSVAVTAMTEETGGSDLAGMQLAAEEDWDGWRLSGRKVHITNAPIASLGMIAGRIPSLGAKQDITLYFTDLNGEDAARGAGAIIPADNLQLSRTVVHMVVAPSPSAAEEIEARLAAAFDLSRQRGASAGVAA